jgi:hypothetical protein
LQTPTKKDAALLDTVLKLLPSQSKVAEYIKRQHDHRGAAAAGRKEVTSLSKIDDDVAPAPAPAPVARRVAASGSLSMDDLSQHVTVSARGSVALLSPEVSVRKSSDHWFRLNSPPGLSRSSSKDIHGDLLVSLLHFFRSVTPSISPLFSFSIATTLYPGGIRSHDS